MLFFIIQVIDNETIASVIWEMCLNLICVVKVNTLYRDNNMKIIMIIKSAVALWFCEFKL